MRSLKTTIHASAGGIGATAALLSFPLPALPWLIGGLLIILILVLVPPVWSGSLSRDAILRSAPTTSPW